MPEGSSPQEAIAVVEDILQASEMGAGSDKVADSVFFRPGAIPTATFEVTELVVVSTDAVGCPARLEADSIVGARMIARAWSMGELMEAPEPVFEGRGSFRIRWAASG